MKHAIIKRTLLVAILLAMGMSELLISMEGRRVQRPAQLSSGRPKLPFGRPGEQRYQLRVKLVPNVPQIIQLHSGDQPPRTAGQRKIRVFELSSPSESFNVSPLKSSSGWTSSSPFSSPRYGAEISPRDGASFTPSVMTPRALKSPRTSRFF